jgi:hypothetical protein
VDRLRKEKLKGKKKKKKKKKKKEKKKKKRNPARILGDDLRAEQHRAEVEELVARLEAELVQRAGEEEEDYEKLDWRGVAQFDLDDSDGEPLYEDPRQQACSDLPQDLRKAPKHEAVEAMGSLVRAAAGRELKFPARAETTVGELAAATTSGTGLAKEQFKVFDPGGGL